MRIFRTQGIKSENINKRGNEKVELITENIVPNNNYVGV